MKMLREMFSKIDDQCHIINKKALIERRPRPVGVSRSFGFFCIRNMVQNFLKMKCSIHYFWRILYIYNVNKIENYIINTSIDNNLIIVIVNIIIFYIIFIIILYTCQPESPNHIKIFKNSRYSFFHPEYSMNLFQNLFTFSFSQEFKNAPCRKPVLYEYF